MLVEVIMFRLGPYLRLVVPLLIDNKVRQERLFYFLRVISCSSVSLADPLIILNNSLMQC